MISDSVRKQFKAVLVYQLDRFARSRYDSAHYKNILKKNEVRVLSARENITDDASGVLMESVLEGMAEYYSVELAQKVKRGMALNAEHGYYTGGNIALGYKAVKVEGTNKKKFAVDESTSPIVRKIFEMYADENKTMAEICRYLNGQGIKTSTGVEFNKGSLKLMLRNKRYIGIYTYNDMEYPGLMPRIIDDDLFGRVQKMVKENKKASGRRKAVGEDEYLLTLRLFCGHCKEMMTGWSGRGRADKKYGYYICKGVKKEQCKKKSVRKEILEDLIVKQCRETLTDENIERIAKEIVAYNEAEQSNNEYLKRLEKSHRDNEKQQLNLMDTLKLCEDDEVKKDILAEISKMKNEAKELQTQLAIEESRKIKITRREIVFFLKDLQNGDVSDVKYRKTLINVLVNKIYIYDDKRLTIVFLSGDATREIDVNLIEDIEKEIEINCWGENGYYVGNVSPPTFPLEEPKKVPPRGHFYLRKK